MVLILWELYGQYPESGLQDEAALGRVDGVATGALP